MNANPRPSPHEVALLLNKVSISFGGLKAVSDLSFGVAKHSITGLIGPNGAGKTTAFNLITGVYRPNSGSVQLDGVDLVGLTPWQMTRKGMARTFQNIRLFKDLTVLENLLIPIDQSSAPPGLSFLWNGQRHLKSEAQKTSRAFEILEIMNLQNKAHEISKSLPYGDQRRLEIARALATGARLILLDEPAAGMNGTETHALMQTIAHLREDLKITVLLIEHDMKLVMGVCEKIVVLDHGQKIAEGSPTEIRKNPQVIEAYLGKS